MTEQNTSNTWDELRVKTPTVLQMEAVECGAASLAMVLGYFGRFIPLEELRSACGVSRDGSKASNVVRAARKYGLTAKGYRKEPHELKGISLPMIVFWNFNHFVVLEGVKKGKAYINDPASGRRTLSYEEFDQSFTGVVLEFGKGKDFIPGGDPPRLIPGLKSRLRGARPALTFAILAGLFLVVPGLVIPVFSKLFVDNILIGGMTNWIKPLLIAMGITALVRFLLTLLQQVYLLRLETKLALAESARFFRHVFQLPMEFFSQRMPGEIGSRIQVNDTVAKLLSGDLATNMLNMLMIVFYLLVMCMYDWVLTLVSLLVAALNLLVLTLVSEKRKILNQRVQQETGKLMGVSMSGLQMVETLKATGSESDFFAEWAGQQAKVINAEQQLAVPTQLLSVLPVFLMALNSTAVLAVGGIRVMDGDLTIGMLVAFQSLMSSFLQPVNQMMTLGGKLQTAQADMNRLDDVFKYRKDDQFTSDTEVLEDDWAGVPKLSGTITLRNLSFGYSRLEPPLIEGFDLELTPGSRVALVGGSGSGKSTVARMVSGLYQPWEGEILFDDLRREEIPRRVMVNSLAMVDQDIFMFEGSIRENLTMWDKEVPDAAVLTASRDACIHDDITARQNGYRSKVEEGGANFSGGQRQRLEIARALSANPTILILDEATSALDPNTEQLVDDSIRRRGCTCLIIAHRLSTVRDCDEIVVLDHGQIVQRGTHEDLISEGGHYADLVKAH